MKRIKLLWQKSSNGVMIGIFFLHVAVTVPLIFSAKAFADCCPPAPANSGSSNYDVDKGNQPDTMHVPYNPPPPKPDPIIRPPDGTERPYPAEPERHPEEHAPENEPPSAEPE